MLQYDGLIEITGKKGSGRTNIVLLETLGKKAMFISLKPFPINRYVTLLMSKYKNTVEVDKHLNNFYIIILNQFKRLRLFVIYKLEYLVKKHNIEFLILYEIDFLLFEEKINHKDVFYIMRELQRIRHVQKIQIIFVTLYKKTFVKNFNLKLGMEYYINRQYRVSKKLDRREIIEMNTNNKKHFFTITDDSVLYFSDTNR